MPCVWGLHCGLGLSSRLTETPLSRKGLPCVSFLEATPGGLWPPSAWHRGRVCLGGMAGPRDVERSWVRGHTSVPHGVHLGDEQEPQSPAARGSRCRLGRSLGPGRQGPGGSVATCPSA